MNKLEELENIDESDPSNESRLIDFTLDEDEEIRFRAIEKLYPFSNSSAVRSRLIDGLSDSDELVKVAALEIFEEWGISFAKDEIEKCLFDEEWLVRGVSALALAATEGRQAEKNILKALDGVINEEEKLRYIASLYMIGNNEYIDEVLCYHNSDNYRIRSAVANLAVTCIGYNHSNDVIQRIISSFEMALMKEESLAVESSIKAALGELKSA